MAGQRASQNPTERSLALIILIVGTVAALGSMFGGLWAMRAGIVIAVLMAFAAVWATLRELDAERVRHAAELKREVALRSEQASRHHAETVAMIDRYNARAENLRAVIAKLRSQLGSARSELSSMRGNAAWLRGEVAERQARIQELEKRIAELEAAAKAEEASNLVQMPQAGLSPNIGDIWGEDEHPTMVDLSKLKIESALASDEDEVEDKVS